MVEVGIVLDTASKVAAIFKSLSEALRQKNPDPTTVRVQISDLQQAVYALQTENLNLQRQILQLESEKAALKHQLVSKDDWKALTANLELFQTSGGATIYARHGKPPYFCVVCINKQILVPLQLRDNLGDCPSCKHIYKLEHPTPQPIRTLQRRYT